MSRFQEYVTSSAFNLSLSKGMIDYLLLLSEGTPWHLTRCLMHEQACERRGLVCRIPNDSGTSKAILTDEGKVVIALLKLAGFSIKENMEAA